MTVASDNKFVRTTQKLLFQRPQLLKISTFITCGLLGTQTVVTGQTGPDAINLTIPQAVIEESVPVVGSPAVPESAPPVTPTTNVNEPMAPDNFTPNPVEIRANEPVSAESSITSGIDIPNEQVPPSLESLLKSSQLSSDSPLSPEINVISPVDYGGAQIDTTDYSVGATMPDRVVSEQTNGCEFPLQVGERVANTACRQIERLSAAASPTTTQAYEEAAVPIHVPGPQQVTGSTTTANRQYYNQAAQSAIKLQVGEKFIFPLSMPASLTSLFGWRIHPIFGAQRFHAGTDLGAPMGTPVVATQSGRVSLANFAGGYGLMVALRHNNNTLESRYAHLSRLLVQAGEWVEQGEVIGLVGSTGNSTGPHLHFELRQLTENGWAVLNPDALLQQTLGTLTQALGNSLTALAGTPIPLETSTTSVSEADTSLKRLPFRPAQPFAN